MATPSLSRERAEFYDLLRTVDDSKTGETGNASLLWTVCCMVVDYLVYSPEDFRDMPRNKIQALSPSRVSCLTQENLTSLNIQYLSKEQLAGLAYFQLEWICTTDKVCKCIENLSLARVFLVLTTVPDQTAKKIFRKLSPEKLENLLILGEKAPDLLVKERLANLFLKLKPKKLKDAWEKSYNQTPHYRIRRLALTVLTHAEQQHTDALVPLVREHSLMELFSFSNPSPTFLKAYITEHPDSIDRILSQGHLNAQTQLCELLLADKDFEHQRMGLINRLKDPLEVLLKLPLFAPIALNAFLNPLSSKLAEKVIQVVENTSEVEENTEDVKNGSNINLLLAYGLISSAPKLNDKQLCVLMKKFSEMSDLSYFVSAILIFPPQFYSYLIAAIESYRIKKALYPADIYPQLLLQALVENQAKNHFLDAFVTALLKSFKYGDTPFAPCDFLPPIANTNCLELSHSSRQMVADLATKMIAFMKDKENNPVADNAIAAFNDLLIENDCATSIKHTLDFIALEIKPLSDMAKFSDSNPSTLSKKQKIEIYEKYVLLDFLIGILQWLSFPASCEDCEPSILALKEVAKTLNIPECIEARNALENLYYEQDVWCFLSMKGVEFKQIRLFYQGTPYVEDIRTLKIASLRDLYILDLYCDKTLIMVQNLAAHS